MGEAVDKLISLARVSVEGYTRVVNGKVVNVEAHQRSLAKASLDQLKEMARSTDPYVDRSYYAQIMGEIRRREEFPSLNSRLWKVEGQGDRLRQRSVIETPRSDPLSRKDYDHVSAQRGDLLRRDTRLPALRLPPKALKEMWESEFPVEDWTWSQDSTIIDHERSDPDIKKYLHKYILGDFDPVNRSLRGLPQRDYEDDREGVGEKVAGMDRLFEKYATPAPKDTRVFRFLPVSDEFDPGTLSPGTTLLDKGFLSTTYNSRSSARAFGAWRMNIYVKKGTKALVGETGEQEMIFNRGTLLEIQSVDPETMVIEVLIRNR